MPQVVVTGAQLKCSFGLAPGIFTALPTNRVLGSKLPVGTITDSKPLVNIGSFGMCTSIANPMVAAATTAALGVLTPMPCTPATAVPWVPVAPMTLVGGLPVLTTGCVTMCQWAGVIEVVSPGQLMFQAK